jgi:hypothetical protein
MAGGNPDSELRVVETVRHVPAKGHVSVKPQVRAICATFAVAESAAAARFAPVAAEATARIGGFDAEKFGAVRLQGSPGCYASSGCAAVSGRRGGAAHTHSTTLDNHR